MFSSMDAYQRWHGKATGQLDLLPQSILFFQFDPGQHRIGVENATKRSNPSCHDRTHCSGDASNFRRDLRLSLGARHYIFRGQNRRLDCAWLLRQSKDLIMDDALASVGQHTRRAHSGWLREEMQGRTGDFISHGVQPRTPIALRYGRWAIAELGTTRTASFGWVLTSLFEKQQLGRDWL